MKIKKKHLYRALGGFLSVITLTTSVLPAFAFDKLPRTYDGTNPYVIEEQEPLSAEEMLTLLETLKKPYEIAQVEEIESVPDSEYVLECEEATGENVTAPVNSGEPRNEARLKRNGALRLFAPRTLSDEIEINTDISLIPSVNVSGYSYSFDSLALSETCADAEELKKVVVSLDGENFSKVLSDISTTGSTWNTGAIDYSFEPERVYRFVIEYTYERKVYDAPDVSGGQNSSGTNGDSAPIGTSGMTYNTDVSANESDNADITTDISQNNAISANSPMADISGSDVSTGNAESQSNNA